MGSVLSEVATAVDIGMIELALHTDEATFRNSGFFLTPQITLRHAVMIMRHVDNLLLLSYIFCATGRIQNPFIHSQKKNYLTNKKR